MDLKMSSTNGTALKYTTTCQLCGFRVIDHPMNVQAGKPDARIQNFVSALMKHLQKMHPDAWEQVQGLWQFFLGFLCIGQFGTEDPNIVKAMLTFGAQLRSMVKFPPIPDADIEGAAAALGFTMDDPKREPVIAAMKNVRAYYEGTLQKSAAPEPQKPLVTL
jgi:hypothetical protein